MRCCEANKVDCALLMQMNLNRSPKSHVTLRDRLGWTDQTGVIELYQQIDTSYSASSNSQVQFAVDSRMYIIQLSIYQLVCIWANLLDTPRATLSTLYIKYSIDVQIFIFTYACIYIAYYGIIIIKQFYNEAYTVPYFLCQRKYHPSSNDALICCHSHSVRHSRHLYIFLYIYIYTLHL